MTSTAVSNNKATKVPDKVMETDNPDTKSVARPGEQSVRRSALITDQGATHISDSVVAKIAGLAAREIPGVHSMGTGMARKMGQLRSLVPGGGEGGSPTQGVGVEVGERQAAVDLDLVTWYGHSIVEIAAAVRANVMDRVEKMTGLQVVEVNINVDDIHVDSEPREQRVQ